MKRLVLTVTGTTAAVAALLSIKSQGQPLTSAALPSAALGGTTSAAAPAVGATSTAPGSAPSTSAASSSSSSAASSSAAPTTAAPVAKSYVGSPVTTRYGIVEVKATVSGHTITHVSFVELTAFDGHSRDINAMAGPQLLTETLTAQSAKVDTVSGASYTSDGYRRSLQSALDKAGLS